MADFERKFGVHIDVRDGHYVGYPSGSGFGADLFSYDAKDKDWYKKAQTEMDRHIAETTARIQKYFPVTFSKNEYVDRQLVMGSDGKMVPGPAITARPPQLRELLGVEAALYNSQPSALTKDGGVKFYFLNQTFGADGPSAAHYVNSDKNGKPAIYFGPESQVLPITVKDAKTLDKDAIWSVEGLADHELAHNGEHNMGWDDPIHGGGRYASQLGWAPFVDPKTRESGFLLKGKHGDLYRCVGINSEPVWFQSNASGQPLDATGHVVAQKDAPKFTLDQMRDQALYRPPTTYFVNPMEEMTDGLRMLRASSDTRAQLLKESPTLYDVVKGFDQDEIDHTYGKQQYVRAPGGSLLDYRQRNTVVAFENSARQ